MTCRHSIKLMLLNDYGELSKIHVQHKKIYYSTYY